MTAMIVPLMAIILSITNQDSSYSLDQIIDAIDWVESKQNDQVKDGDGGAAIGRFQIHECYWKDAIEFDPSIGGTYQDCRKYDYARRIVIAYWKRYCPKALDKCDAKVLSRVHNGGGPRGATKKSTLPYWEKVKARLETLT